MCRAARTGPSPRLQPGRTSTTLNTKRYCRADNRGLGLSRSTPGAEMQATEGAGHA